MQPFYLLRIGESLKEFILVGSLDYLTFLAFIDGVDIHVNDRSTVYLAVVIANLCNTEVLDRFLELQYLGDCREYSVILHVNLHVKCCENILDIVVLVIDNLKIIFKGIRIADIFPNLRKSGLLGERNRARLRRDVNTLSGLILTVPKERN